MSQADPIQGKPPVVVCKSDYGRLWTLAISLHVREGDVADQLMTELDRARIVPDDQIGAEVIAMGTTVRFTMNTGEDRTVTLVYPNEADIDRNRISVLTPVGAALIGLASGQSIDWHTLDGTVRRLTVETVIGHAR